MWEALTQYGAERALDGVEEEKFKDKRFYSKIGPDCIFNDMKNYNKNKKYRDKTYQGINMIQA